MSYENEVAQTFEGMEKDVKLICAEKEFEKAFSSLEYDIFLYELINLKLADGKMIGNVDYVKIASVIEEKKIVNTIEFYLKTSGERWSQLFSRKIASAVFSKIEFYNGNVKNYYHIDLNKKQEKLTFIFTHQRLDLFMDGVVEEKVTTEFKVARLNRERNS